MPRPQPPRALGALALALPLALAACAAPASTTGGTTGGPSAGTPVSSGALRVTPVCEPVQFTLYDDARTNYSLGYENYKNEDFCSALPYLRWLLREDPLFTGQSPDDRNYRRLADTYENLAAMVDSGGDMRMRRAYLDSARAVMAQRGPALTAANLPYDESAAKLGEGRFYLIYADDYGDDSEERARELFMEAFELNAASVDDYYLNWLAQRAATDDDQAAALALLARLQEQADQPAYIAGVRAALQYVVDNPTGAAGTTAATFGTPEQQYEALLAEYRGGNTSDDVVARLASLAYQLERNAVFDELAPRLAELRASVPLYRALAGRAARQGNLTQAFEYFRQAIDLSNSAAEKRDIYYQMANAAYRAGNRGEAYRLAGQALEFDRGHGASMFLRASIVGATVPRSGSIQQRAAYWCVADLFRAVANTGDPQVAAAARRAAAQYAAAGPSREEYFINPGWRPGQSVSTSHGYGACTTTVR